MSLLYPDKGRDRLYCCILSVFCGEGILLRLPTQEEMEIATEHLGQNLDKDLLKLAKSLQLTNPPPSGERGIVDFLLPYFLYAGEKSPERRWFLMLLLGFGWALGKVGEGNYSEI